MILSAFDGFFSFGFLGSWGWRNHGSSFAFCNLTIFILNKSESSKIIDLLVSPTPEEGQRLARFEVTEAALEAPKFTLQALGHIDAIDSPLRLELEPSSLTALTTFDLAPDAPGLIVD